MINKTLIGSSLTSATIGYGVIPQYIKKFNTTDSTKEDSIDEEIETFCTMLVDMAAMVSTSFSTTTSTVLTINEIEPYITASAYLESLSLEQLQELKAKITDMKTEQFVHKKTGIGA